MFPKKLLINYTVRMEQPKIAIVVINYNNTDYLPTCLDSIFSQTHKNLLLIFIDNNSSDAGWRELLNEKYGAHSNLKIVTNTDNLGYAKAANQGIRIALEESADYIAITNPDIIYTPHYFEMVVNRAKEDPKIAAITGKTCKYDFDRHKPTNIIDTVGIFAYKNRRFIDDGQGLIDEGQFDEEYEVFGVSGASPLYRGDALKDVEIFGEYLDEDFFMYKEDVDLSWRFLLYGWKNLYYPKAIAYHGRGTGVYRRFFGKEVLSNRNKLSKFQKKYSFKNQFLMEAKNELWGNFFKDFFPIMFKRLAMLGYITVKEPYLWGSFFTYLKQLPRILRKRKIIMKNKKVTAKEMSKWFQKQSKYIKS